MDGLSRRIARHVVGTSFADLPPRVVAVAKQSLLDAIGVTLAASALGEGAAAFAALAREAESDRGATVIGFGFKAAPAMAAFANGAMAHSLDYEDTFDPALMHRIAVLAAGTLDALPHNGAIVTLLSVCGATHRESYPPILMAVILGPIVALIAVVVLGSVFGSF